MVRLNGDRRRAQFSQRKNFPAHHTSPAILIFVKDSPPDFGIPFMELSLNAGSGDDNLHTDRLP
jgi:hypothetical protein